MVNVINARFSVETAASKWGNSNGIRIPKEVLSMVNLAGGSEVTLIVCDRVLTVEQARRKPSDLRKGWSCL